VPQEVPGEHPAVMTVGEGDVRGIAAQGRDADDSDACAGVIYRPVDRSTPASGAVASHPQLAGRYPCCPAFALGKGSRQPVSRKPKFVKYALAVQAGRRGRPVFDGRLRECSFHLTERVSGLEVSPAISCCLMRFCGFECRHPSSRSSRSRMVSKSRKLCRLVLGLRLPAFHCPMFPGGSTARVQTVVTGASQSQTRCWS